MEELSNPKIQQEAAEGDGFSLIDGSTLDDLFDSMSETSFVDDEVNILDKEVNKLEKPEAPMRRKNEKYDLRKSLAWDRDFRICAGVLDDEELSRIIEGSNSGRPQMQHLPGIQEDMSKSTDSLSTLESDNLALESLEADLFCDIRASIQRSGEASKLRKLNSNRGPEGTDSGSLSGTKSTALHGNMVKQISVSRKLKASIQGDGKLMKLGPVREQLGKPGGSRRESQVSLSKLPAASDGKKLRATAAAKIPSKRMSISNGCKNSSLNSVGNSMGSAPKVSKGPQTGDSYSTIPKAAPSAKSSSQSSAIRIGTSSTQSSYDSTSSSSVRSRILPLNGLQGKAVGAVSKLPSSLRSRLPSRVPLKGTIQPRTSRNTAYLSTPKHSPSASPTSSISEWSSSSSVATVNQEHYGSKGGSNLHRTVSLESISSHDFQVHPTEQTSKDQEHEVTGLPNISAHKLLADNESKSNPVSAKPSGLRMPSPKIGFFDGGKTGGKTSKTGMQSSSGLPTSRFVRSATGSSSPGGIPNKGRVGHAVVMATAIAAGKTNANTQKSNARSAPTGCVDEKPPAPVKATNGTHFEDASTTLPKTKGQSNISAAKKSGLVRPKKIASPERMHNLKGNQVSGVAEADQHPLEIYNDSKVFDIQLLHGLIDEDTADTELDLVSVPKEADTASIVYDENANIEAKSGGNEVNDEKYGQGRQACVVITNQQNVSAKQQENGLSGHVEAVSNKTELCEDMNGNFEPQSTVDFSSSDMQLLHVLINGETNDTELDLVNVSIEVGSTCTVDNESRVAVYKSEGNEATNEKHDGVCVVIADQENLSIELLKNGMSEHVEALGNNTESEDMSGSFEPHSTVNFASSGTQLLHGLINGDTTGTELDLATKEVDSSCNVDDENVVAVAKRGGNEANNGKYDQVCGVITDHQQNVGAEKMEIVGNETELSEDMNGDFEPQDPTATEFGLVNVSKEVDSTFNVDDEAAVAVAKSEENEATQENFDRVCGVITDQQNVSPKKQETILSGHVEAVGNETELCEDMDCNFEPQSTVNLNSESYLPAVSSCIVELLGFNQKEDEADLSDKHTECSISLSVPKSNPGSRTPFADKNSLSDAYSVDALVKNFTSLTLNSVQRENVEAEMTCI